MSKPPTADGFRDLTKPAKRGRGRPKAEDDVWLLVALEYYKRRMLGASHASAFAEARNSVKRPTGKSKAARNGYPDDTIKREIRGRRETVFNLITLVYAVSDEQIGALRKELARRNGKTPR